MPIITKNTITYNETDFLAGLHPQYGTKTIPQKFGSYSRNQYNFNPFDDLGYAKNGFLGVDFKNENLVLSRIIKTIIATDGLQYAIDSKNLMHRFSNAGGTSSEVDSTVAFPYTTGGASTINSDIIQHYAANSKVNAIFFAYNGESTGDIGSYSIDDSTSDLDFMSTRPSGGATLSVNPHPLCVGHDDKLYIGDGRYLHVYDYADTADSDGKLTRFVLTLPEGYQIKSIQKLQPRSLVIFAQKGLLGRGETVKAFFWDYLSLDPYQIKDLYDDKIVTSFEYKGTIGCLTYSSIDHKSLKIFNGSEFSTIARMRKPGSGSESEPPIGCIDVVDNEIYIHTGDQSKNYIYKYGNNDNIKSVLSIVGSSISGVVGGYNAGVIKYCPQYDTFIVSSGLDDASSATIQYIDKTKYSTDGFWYSDLIDIGDERIQITGITVYFADEFTGGRTISLSLTDRYNTYAISGLTNLATVTPTNRIYKAKPILNTAGTPIPPLDGIGLNLIWGSGSGSSVTPIINKVVLDYKPVTIN